MISIDKINLSFGGFQLFKELSFLINPKDRIGLVGKNGAGKSTLLKIITGQEHPTKGAVVVPKGISIGYLPQQMKVSDTRTLKAETTMAFEALLQLDKDIARLNREIAESEDYHSEVYLKKLDTVAELNERYQLLGGDNYEAELEQTLMGLGFERKDFDRMTSEFSGGWRMRVELAKLLLKKPDIFLLDEPTNHLDIESIQWLEDFLKTYSGAVILVSHDRTFLDAVCNRTIEISLGKITDQKMTYTKFVDWKVEQREIQMAAFRNQQKLIEDTEKFIERFRYKATKAVQVQSRIKQLEKLDRIEIEEEDNSALKLNFPPAPRSGRVVVEAKHISKNYGKLHVLDDIDLKIEQGEKVAFVGRNGEGKTTLARIIMNELEHSGNMKLGHNVKIGYFAQNQAQLLNEELTIFETIDEIAVGDIRTKIRDILAAFLFRGEDIDKKVKVLSGGEKSRLAMIRLMLEPVNFLILDEPTNHLDMRSKEILKNALAAFTGTVLVVSHDRDFLDGLVNCIYEFRHKKAKQHLGGIFDFLYRKKMESMQELEQQKKNTPVKQEAKKLNNKELSFEEKKEVNRNISRLEKKVNKNEESISDLEQKIEDMDKVLSAPEGIEDHSIFEQYEDLKANLEVAMQDWEKAHEELEDWKEKKPGKMMKNKGINKEDFLFGTRAVIEAIKKGKTIDKILIKKGLNNDLFLELQELIKENNIPVQYVPVEKINRVTQKNHQGVLAFVSPIEFDNIETVVPGIFEKGETPLILILDHITDVRNFGAIARSAECGGVHAIVIPDKGMARIGADAVKTSAGAIHHIPICKVKNITDAVSFLQASGIYVVAATEKGRTVYTQTEFTKPLGIVMGAEDTGVSKQLLRIADEQIRIPILGKIESLNVSVSAALLIFETVRQRS